MAKRQRHLARPSAWPHRASGFTYLTLLFLIAITATSAAAAATYWHIQQRRSAEQELIRIGAEFRAAIRRYYHASTGTVKHYPATLDDLILDRRYLGVKRHLRRIYRDPVTGAAEWGVVRAPDGGVMGVHSLSTQTPIRSRALDSDDVQSKAGARYSDWQFVYREEKSQP